MRSFLAHPPALPHQQFDTFYRRYAASLWGLIVLAQLPASQSEAILINTLLKAWQQRQQTSLVETHLFAQILRIAYQEGLPINPSIGLMIWPIHSSLDKPS